MTRRPLIKKVIRKRSAKVIGRDDADELGAEMLAAPFRMLGAAIAGGFLSFVAFGLAWLPYIPSHSRDLDVLMEMFLRILLRAVVGMAMGVAVAWRGPNGPPTKAPDYP